MGTPNKGVSRQKQIEATQEEQQSMMQAEQLLEGGQVAEQQADNIPPEQQKPEENQKVEPEYPNERARQEAEMVINQRHNRRIDHTRERIEHGLEVPKEDLEYLQAHDRGEFVQKRDQLQEEKAQLEQIQQEEEQNPEGEEQNKDTEFEEEQDLDVNLDKPGIYGDKIVAKVDGQLRELTPEQALSAIQKNLSADKRLEMASQEVKRLEQWETQLLQMQQDIQQRATQPPSQGVDSMPSAEIQGHAKDLINMIEDGDTDAATEALARLLTQRTPQQPAINPKDIERQVTQQVESKLKLTEAEQVESKLKSSGQYDDIFNDALAYEQASENVGLLMSRGEKGSFEEIMRKGMDMYRFMSGTAPQEPERKKVDANTDRAQRKQQLPKAVTGSAISGRKAPIKQNEPTQQQKRASVIAQMKAARNQ